MGDLLKAETETASSDHKAETWRQLFSGLDTKTYLANHSLGAVPKKTAENLQRYFKEWSELGILAWNGPWWESLVQFNSNIETLLGAKPQTVVPMENVTRSLAAIFSAFDFSERNEIVTTNLEFTTTYPFLEGLRSLGAKIKIAESEDGIGIPAEKICNEINEKTLAVLTSHVYFRSGYVQNLAKIVKTAHQFGVHVIGDGYQAVGTLPVNVSELNISFYVGGSHKWLCGGPGAAFLYVRPDLIQSLQPKFTGWFGLQKPFDYLPPNKKHNLHEGVFRFLAGTPSISALYAAREGIETILKVGIQNIRNYSAELTKLILEQAQKFDLAIRTPLNPENRSGMVCIDLKDSRSLCDRLNEQKIIIDWRPDCGMRISPHFYNTKDEIDLFFSELSKLRL